MLNIRKVSINGCRNIIISITIIIIDDIIDNGCRWAVPR